MDKRIDQYTIAELEVKLKSIGAEISHCGQNRNDKLTRLRLGDWSVVLMHPRELEGTVPFRYVVGSGRTISIAIIRAIQEWERPPGDFGESKKAWQLSREQVSPRTTKEKLTATSGEDLLKQLGL